MRRIIQKYELVALPGCVTRVQMPLGARVMAADAQFNALFIWVLIDSEQPAEEGRRTFHCISTGQELPDTPGRALRHVDTVMMQNGLVWHVFEEIMRES